MKSSTTPPAAQTELPTTDPERHSGPAALSRREKILAMAGTLAALLMAGLDQTIVSTAGPEIQRDLQIAASLYPWLTTAYLVSSTVLLPVYGKLSDTLGRKPVLLVGVSLFLLGSLLCGFAPTTGFLIAARAIQGMGAASLFTTTFAVIADLFPPQERGKYMGLIGGVMGISSVVGPVLGGIITDALGWHWVFFINLPVGLVAMWLIVTAMPSLGGAHGGRARIDVAGAAWLVAGVIPLLLAMSLGRPASTGGTGYAWGSAPIIGMFALSVVALGIFIRTELRAEDPILNLSLFTRDRTIGVTALTMFVLGATFLFTVVFLPLYLVNVLGISVASAGLSLTPMTLAMVATSVGAGQVASRLGHVKASLLASLLLLALSFAILGFTLTPDSSQLSVTLKMVLVGLAMGPTFPLYILIVQEAANPREVGAVTAGSIFSRSMGQVIGLALFGTLFATSLLAGVERGTSAATRGLPASVQSAIQESSPTVSADGESTVLSFDADQLRARLTTSSAIDDNERAVALDAVRQIENAYSSSLTQSVALLYRIGLVLVLIAFFLTLLIPTAAGAIRRPKPISEVT